MALSGGGAHAACHAGALKALDREKIPVSGIVGVSGGALVAAAWAGGADLDSLVDQASRLHPWMWVRGWGGGLLSGSKLGALIDEFLPSPVFEGLKCPVAVVATRGTGLKGGSPTQPAGRVRSSCSVPCVSPLLLAGRASTTAAYPGHPCGPP